MSSIYAIKDKKRDIIIYVGRTGRDVETRVQEHYNKAFRLSKFTKSELALALSYDDLEYEIWYEGLSAAGAKLVEDQIVKHYQPIGNTYLV